MYRFSTRSVLLRALLCALTLLLTLAPITGAAAATTDVPEQAKAPDAAATPGVTATDDATAEPTEGATATESAEVTATESAEVTATQEDATQVEAAAPGGGGGANQDGPYTPDPNASPTPSGNGQGKNPHDAGSKGNADDKNPPGQMPGPDDDGNQGYECDGNSGAGRGNPAHSGCPTPNPRINIDKTGPASSSVGATVTYTMSVTNPGNRPLSNVVVSDPRCNTAPTRTGGDTNGDNVLQTTETWTYTCPRLVRSSDTSPLLNTATVRGTSPEGVTVTDEDSHSVTLPAVQPSPPVINIVKTGPDTSAVGATITYTMRVTNPVAAVPLKNVVVTDPRCNAAPVRTGGDTNGDNVLQSSETWTYTCRRTVRAADLDASNVLHNTARVDARSTATDEPVSDTDSHRVTVVPQQTSPSILVRKTAVTPACPVAGDTVTYRFEIINNGSQTLNSVALNDPLLGGAVTVSDTTLTPGEVADATGSYTLTQASIDAGSLANSATVTSRTSSLAPVSNTAQAVVMLEDCPAGVRLVKRGPASARVGDQITYTFTVTNVGDVTLTNVRINDARLRVSNLPVSPSTLEPGQSGTATATYTVTRGDARKGVILNTALVRARTPGGGEIEDEDDHRTTVPRPRPGPEPRIRLVKSGPARAGVGETVTYTFTVTNTGNVTLTNVNVTDPLLDLVRLPVRPETLAPDQQGTATATYVITEADAKAGSVHNTAVARGRGNGRTVRDDDDHTVTVPLVPVCPSPPCGPPPPPPDLPATGIGTTGFALTALLSLALGGVLLGIAGSGNLQAAMASSTVNADSPMLAMLRQWNLAPKPGGSQERRRRRHR